MFTNAKGWSSLLLSLSGSVIARILYIYRNDCVIFAFQLLLMMIMVENRDHITKMIWITIEWMRIRIQNPWKRWNAFHIEHITFKLNWPYTYSTHTYLYINTPHYLIILNPVRSFCGFFFMFQNKIDNVGHNIN